MSTDHMPSPPSTPTRTEGSATAQSPGSLSEAEAAGQVAQAEGAQAEAAPLSLEADIARILREQADVLAQQMGYHSQQLFGVSAIGIDPVNSRNSVMVLAAALESGAADTVSAEGALSHLASAQVSQVNDRTLPYNTHSQVAGLLQGLVLDALSKAYASDPARQREARRLLEPLFQTANDTALAVPRHVLLFGAPGPGPNARK